MKSMLLEDTSKPAKPKHQTLTISQLQERDEEQRKRYEDWARRQRAEGRNVPTYAEYVRQKNTTAGLAGSQGGSKSKLSDHAGPSGMPSKQASWAPSLNPNSPQQPRPTQNGAANGSSGSHPPPSYNGPPSHNGPPSREGHSSFNGPPSRDAYNGPSGNPQSNGYGNTSPPKAYLPQRKPAAPQFESHNGSPKLDGIAPIVSPPPHSRSYSE
jgi:hypothetical protein